MESNKTRKYPKCFPLKFETEILPKEAKQENRTVYRVIKFGKLDRESFISSFEEMERGFIPHRKNLNLDDPGIYSTSCFMEYSEAQYILRLMMRHHPRPFIAKGETEGTCGPSQLTIEREKKHRGPQSHVDWWIYEKSTPQRYFEKDEKNE